MRFPQPGDQFGRYRIERILGQGGMGVVYAATDLRLERLVAVKVITGPLAQNEEFLRRFHDEAAVLAQLDSPYLIAITDHDQIDGLPFIVTQYVEGTDLGSLLQRGPLPARVALTICAQVARGLGDAHRSGVIHRDIKPANVLVRDAGTADVHAYVCDFGIARSESSDGHTATGLVAGTWAYLAPERTQGRPATRASDLYALGCVLWTCLVGREPYTGTEVEMAIAHTQAPVPRLAGDTPFVAELNAVLGRLLAKDPDDRYRDAGRVRADLDRLADQAPPGVTVRAAAPAATGGGFTSGRVSAVPPTVLPPPPPARLRSRRPLAVAAIAVLALAGVGVAWAVSPDGDDDSRRVPLGVTADVDGDGTGDVVVQQNREGTLVPIGTWTLPSTGSAFDGAAPGRAADGLLRLGDVDGDGVPDQTWSEASDDGTALVVEVVEADGHEWSAEVSLDPALIGPAPVVQVADLTQDGLADLVLHDESNSEGGFAILVAENQEDSFGTPEQWYADDASGSGRVLLDAGDVDGDGTTDLVATVDGAGDVARGRAVRLLTSDGSRLTAGGPIPISDRGYGFGVWLVADLDGDGTDEPLVAGRHGLAVLDVTDGASGGPVRVLEAEGRAAEWLRGAGGTGSDLWGVSDVDGDGDDDVVHLRLDETSASIGVYTVDVHEAQGGALAPAVRWGEVECGQECGDAFLVVPPAR